MDEADVTVAVRKPGHLVRIDGDRKWFEFVMEGYRLHGKLDHGPVTPPLF
jgi:hypothetical protein